MMILVVSVFPAPDSPDTRIVWFLAPDPPPPRPPCRAPPAAPICEAHSKGEQQGARRERGMLTHGHTRARTHTHTHNECPVNRHSCQSGMEL